jgi:hypothetical protein
MYLETTRHLSETKNQIFNEYIELNNVVVLFTLSAEPRGPFYTRAVVFADENPKTLFSNYCFSSSHVQFDAKVP